MDGIVGHQGGWDELLVVAVPLALFAMLLWVAARRARAESDADDRAPVEVDDPEHLRHQD